MQGSGVGHTLLGGGVNVRALVDELLDERRMALISGFGFMIRLRLRLRFRLRLTWSAAPCRGVSESRVVTCTEAPLSSSKCMIPSRPCLRDYV